MGVIGIIGTVDESHAHNTTTIEYHIHKQGNFESYLNAKHIHVILDESICNQNTTKISNSIVNTYDSNVYIHNYFDEHIKYTVHYNSNNEPRNNTYTLIPDPNYMLYLPSSNRDGYYKIDLIHPCNIKDVIHIPTVYTHKTTSIEPMHFNNNSESQINTLETQLDKQKAKIDKKIEEKMLWKERYNTCYDKKENFKTKLNQCNESKSTLETQLNQYKLDNVDNENQCTQLLEDHETQITNLESKYNLLLENNTDSQFTIEKLKQEKANLTKQVEELETDNQDLQQRIKELEG